MIAWTPLEVGQRVNWSRDPEVTWEIFWIRQDEGRAGIRCTSGTECHAVDTDDLEVSQW